MSKSILLAYKCQCGKYHDIYWQDYKKLLEYKKEDRCYCDIINRIKS